MFAPYGGKLPPPGGMEGDADLSRELKVAVRFTEGTKSRKKKKRHCLKKWGCSLFYVQQRRSSGGAGLGQASISIFRGRESIISP